MKQYAKPTLEAVNIVSLSLDLGEQGSLNLVIDTGSGEVRGWQLDSSLTATLLCGRVAHYSCTHEDSSCLAKAVLAS